MSERDLIQDLVVLFDPVGNAVRQEMRLADFEELRCGASRLAHRAGESVRAAYVTVGPGLRVRGLVFFLLPVDSTGNISKSFNIPIQYLLENAGVRSDLGIGVVHVASRGQCPVPWMALQLWEPDVSDEGAARMVQRAVLMNRLGLSSRPAGRITQALGRAGPDLAGPDPAGPELTDRQLAAPDPGPGAGVSRSGGAPSFDTFMPERAAAPVAAPALRDDSWAIEYSYLEQIRKLKAEIHELRAALRFERDRYRRLHALLRGDF